MALHPGLSVPADWDNLPDLAKVFNQHLIDRCYEHSLGCYEDTSVPTVSSYLYKAKSASCLEVYDKACPDGYSIGKEIAAAILVAAEEFGGSGRGKGGKSTGCNCFLAGTDVLMADGTVKDIEDVAIGDEVLATDPATGKSASKKVTRLIRTEADKNFNDLSIATEDGIEKLTATYEHPFWSPSEGEWIPADDLAPGMTLLTDEADTVIVTANRKYTQNARTYNLTVDDLHTYYVLAGQTPVLVHNSNCGDVILGSGEGTADALRAFTSTKPETEFVFDSGAGRFLAGDRERIPGGLSPHEQLAEKAGMDRGTVLGGTLFRDNGRLVFTENSGHYGHRWTDATRQQFQKFMSDQGIDFDYRPWG